MWSWFILLLFIIAICAILYLFVKSRKYDDDGIAKDMREWIYRDNAPVNVRNNLLNGLTGGKGGSGIDKQKDRIGSWKSIDSAELAYSENPMADVENLHNSMKKTSYRY